METQSTCSGEAVAPEGCHWDPDLKCWVEDFEREYPPLEDDMVWTGSGFIRTKYYGLDDL